MDDSDLLTPVQAAYKPETNAIKNLVTKPSITTALIAAKRLFSPIKKDGFNPHFKSRYATLDAVLDAISHALATNGLLITQPIVVRGDKQVLITILSLAGSWDTIESEMILPTVSDPQKLGSAISYYRRYAICSLLGITADEDDDANTVTASPQSQALTVSNPHPKSVAADEERKAITVHDAIKSVGVKPAQALSICAADYGHENIRSLNWEQINFLCTKIKRLRIDK
jgi:ERF superfamily